MKKIYIFVLVLFAIVSCVDALTETNTYDMSQISEDVSDDIIPITKADEDLVDPYYSDYPYTREEDSLYIESLGWKINKMYEDNQYYIVNGELLFQKEDLLINRNSVQERLVGNKIDPHWHHILLNVTYYDNDIYNILKEAVAEWNSIEGCNIYFAIRNEYEYSTYNWGEIEVEINNISSYNFNDTQYLELGMAILPSFDDKLPASYFYIDVDNTMFSSLSSEQKKYAIMHSLGHVINLEDSDDNNFHLQGTAPDIFTIMNSYSYLQEWSMQWSGFSDYDKEYLAYLYPIQESIVHGVSLNETVDSQLSSNQLTQYKAHEFTSELISPKRGDEDFYCEYLINGPSDDYVITAVNDTTVSIRFNTLGTYRITSVLKSNDISNLYFESNTRTYEIVNDKIFLPEITEDDINATISLNVPFELKWVYSHPNYPDADIVVTGEEYYFGDGSENVEISEITNGTVSVTLSEYGRYRITMRAVTPGGQILERRTFLIDEYWRPEMSVVQDGIHLLYTPNYFRKHEDTISEYPRLSSKASFSSGTATIKIGTTQNLQHNFYADLYMSYFRQYEEYGIVERRMDVRFATEDIPFNNIKRNSGSNNVTYGPFRAVFAMGVSDECGVPKFAYANYMGHPVIIIPNDNIAPEENI